MIAQLSIHAIRASWREHRWFHRRFARLLTYLNLLAEAIVESRVLARAARKRYPFVD